MTQMSQMEAEIEAGGEDWLQRRLFFICAICVICGPLGFCSTTRSAHVVL
jgi:hypothetical protein